MRRLLLVGVVLIVSSATGQESASKLWSDLKAKREMLPGLHQEFEVSRTSSALGSSRTYHQRIVIDLTDKRWRERSISGSCDCVRIFDGQDLFLMEADRNEYIRINRKSKDDDPEPQPYGTLDLDWRKAKEVARRPCGLATEDHSCIVIYVPEKAWARAGKGTLVTRLAAGVSQLTIDSETGALVRSDNEEVIEQSLDDLPGRSAWALSGKPMEQWNDTLAEGFATWTEGKRYQAVLRPDPPRPVWVRSSQWTNRQLSVGKTVNLSPRAGCAKSACPVR